MSFDPVSFAMGKAASSGGGIAVEELSVTENGTYTAPTGKAYSPVTVAVTPSPSPMLAWDFTSETPLVDTVRGIKCEASNVTFSAEGGAFLANGASCLYIPCLGYGMTIEIDVKSSNISSAAVARNFVLSSTGNGFWKSTSYPYKWAFNSEYTDITDPNYFSGHTLKIEIDKDGKWKIYRDDNLLLATTGTLKFAAGTVDGLYQNYFKIGNSSNAIQEINISAVRIY